MPQSPQRPQLTALRSSVIYHVMRSFLSATEFARVVQRGKKTIIRWINKSLIPGVKRVGHVYQIPVSEVETYQLSAHYPPPKWQK